ncbi:MAG: 16S rRNA (uracil(1498)-N(3))-methyltransferase [Clostridia bacterium]|nr:16S rRNA (uracil(1498)-N(3))-methyltransferase [Clostridia bacterium]
MHRFFVEPGQIQGNICKITGDDAWHIQKVLRLGIDEEIILCDSQGMDYIAVIQFVDKSLIQVKIVSQAPSKAEPKIEVSLLQALPKSSKMETIIQKCVELGIYEILPITTMRTVVRISDDRDARKKVQRWQKVAEEAAKQSKRGIIPHIYEPIGIQQAVNECNADLKLLFWEEEKEQSLHSLLHSQVFAPKSTAMLVGPEGGLDNSESELAKQHGWVSVSLGSRILRTETAGMAALAAIMYHWREWE